MSASLTFPRTSFGRAPHQSFLRPTEREVRWLKHIERHGPQSSQYLHALTSGTHRCRDTSLRQLQKLRAAGFLWLPLQQRQTAKADFNPYIYDLTSKARTYLADLGLGDATVRPTGHWWHSTMTACVTSSIDIAAAQAGVHYIPAHEILARRNATLAIPVGQAKLIPDQLFALDYGGQYRVFALEVDRGTEPKRSVAARKSLVSSLAQYTEILTRQTYKDHYGLNANLLVLWVFAAPTRQKGFLEIASEMGSSLMLSTLCQTLDGPDDLYRPNKGLFENPWSRADGSKVYLNRA